MPAVQPTHVVQGAIPCRDVERAKAFYAQQLGLNHLFDAPPGLSFFQCGQTRLMLSQPEGPDTASASILYYGVPEARAAQSALEANGISFEEDARCIARVSGRDVWLAICRDSEGNLLGLMSEEDVG